MGYRGLRIKGKNKWQIWKLKSLQQNSIVCYAETTRAKKEDIKTKETGS